jgi:hypothetical protein
MRQSSLLGAFRMRPKSVGSDLTARLALCVAIPAGTVAFASAMSSPAAAPATLQDVALSALLAKAAIALLLAPVLETPILAAQAHLLAALVRLPGTAVSLLTAATWACLHSLIRGEGWIGPSAVLTFPMFCLCALTYLAWRGLSIANALLYAMGCHFAWNLSTLLTYFALLPR